MLSLLLLLFVLFILILLFFFSLSCLAMLQTYSQPAECTIFQKKQKVLLTGASGFIAGYIIKQLIKDGFYIVGTVRSYSKGELLMAQNPRTFEYTIVKDVTQHGAFDSVFKAHPDIVYVLHTVSQFSIKTQAIEEDIIKPAIEANISILMSAKKYGKNIKKVVITSSFAANIQLPFDSSNSSFVYTEDVWNNITYEEAMDSKNQVNAIIGSKAFAERAVWIFQKSETPKFAICTVQIPYVWGPPISSIGVGYRKYSNEIIQEILKTPKDSKSIVECIPYYVDVRDAAQAHISGMTNNFFDNKRCLCVAGVVGSQLILDTIRNMRLDLREKLAVGVPGSFSVDDWPKIDNSATRKNLGFTFRPLEETLSDTVDWLLSKKIKCSD